MNRSIGLSVVCVALTVAALCGAGCGDSNESSEGDAAIERRIDRERNEAARDARQEERIKQLEKELKRAKTTTTVVAGSSGSGAGESSGSGSPTVATGDWPGGSAYTVVLASESSESAARATQRRATAAGLDAGVLNSSNYSSLRPGYWVVFSGAYPTNSQARERQSRARELGFADAYARFVSR